MGVVGSRVGIVGGSIAGCAMAVAAERLGCDVTVFEASAGELKDRGAGIFIPIPLREQLVASGYLAADTPYCHPPERIWITSDPAEPTGRVMWRHAFPGAAHNWAGLWRVLRNLVPGSAHRTWPEVLAAFEAERRPAGTEMVEISRLLGHGLVGHTPDWAAMTCEQAERFITSLIAGHKLYMQPSLPGAQR